MITIDFKNNLEYSLQTTISSVNDVNLKIIDRLEGDVILIVKLAVDTAKKESYSRYIVIDSHKAELLITNADRSKFTSTKDKIIIGTYKNKYIVNLKYILEPQQSDATSVIRFKFFLTAQ